MRKVRRKCEKSEKVRTCVSSLSSPRIAIVKMVGNIRDMKNDIATTAITAE